MTEMSHNSEKARLRDDRTHQTSAHADGAAQRPVPSDYRNPNAEATPSGHSGPDTQPYDTTAPHTSGEPTDPDASREPDDADTLKHRPEDSNYGSGNNALGRTRGEVKNISPDDHVEERQAEHEARK